MLLLRHAETSDPERFHGAESDVGLGESGFRQAADVAGRLAQVGPAAVYSSGMRRARETGQAIATACSLELRIVETLHERRMGPLSGVAKDAGWPQYAEAMRRWMAGELDYTHEGGESYAQMRERLVPPFRALARRHFGETIVVVAHGVVIRVLLTSLLEDIPPQRFDWIGIGFVAVNDLRWDGNGWRAQELARKPDID